MENIIKNYALKNGMCDIGICGAYDFEYERTYIENSADSITGFVEKDIEKRIKPCITLKNAKSIIVVAKNYYKNYSFKCDSDIRGYISMGAVGIDYHIYMKNVLSGLSAILKNYGANSVYFSDTGPLSDRAAALRSGIGYRGKNGCVVTKNGGSAVFLGYIITDIKLKTEKTLNENCGSCRKCIYSCPTGAISENGFNLQKCISYITQLKRKLTKNEIKMVGLNLYGCDVCQKVCVKNKIKNEFVYEIDTAMPKIEYILKMSNSQFKNMYSKTAMGWRGVNVIKRNAICALLKYKEGNALSIAKSMLNSESDIIKDTAKKVIDIMRE